MVGYKKMNQCFTRYLLLLLFFLVSVTQANTAKVTYFGEDKVALLQENKDCVIAIAGRDNEKIVSVALFFPDAPEGIFLFAKSADVTNAVNFIAMLGHEEYKPSKSYLHFNQKLYPLPQIALNGVDQPVYIFAIQKDLTTDMLGQDSFVGQFHDSDNKADMTTIKYGLNGFMDAVHNYNQNCAKST